MGTEKEPSGGNGGDQGGGDRDGGDDSGSGDEVMITPAPLGDYEIREGDYGPRDKDREG
jgi:hypothetical protein